MQYVITIVFESEEVIALPISSWCEHDGYLTAELENDIVNYKLSNIKCYVVRSI